MQVNHLPKSENIDINKSMSSSHKKQNKNMLPL